jgi:hypothetical protein
VEAGPSAASTDQGKNMKQVGHILLRLVPQRQHLLDRILRLCCRDIDAKIRPSGQQILDQSSTMCLNPQAPFSAPPADSSAAELMENHAPNIPRMPKHFPQCGGVDALISGHENGKQADHLATAWAFKALDEKIR